MIKVGIDTSPLTNQNAFRGVGSYTKNLINSLKKFPEVEVVLGNRREIEPRVDLIHFPFFDFFFHTLPFLKKKPTVVTIHDCIPLVLREKYLPGIKGKLKFFLQKMSLRGVSAVITDSESSKKDIIKYLGVPGEKINVVYLAADTVFRPITDTSLLHRIIVKYELPEKFILYVGDVNYNKNIRGLIEAFSLIKDKVGLVLVGKSFENDNLRETFEIKQLIDEKSLRNKVKILGYIEEVDLTAIYNLASVYCQPSFYEGFGLQILEAMACGAPVVTGDVSSMPEVAGEAGVLVDPYSTKNIAEAIYRLVNDKGFKEEKIKEGFENIKRFSWQKTAEETIKVYEEVLEK